MFLLLSYDQQNIPSWYKCDNIFFPPSRCCKAVIRQSGVDLTVLMEQFLDGPEVDVDATWLQENREIMEIFRKNLGIMSGNSV